MTIRPYQEGDLARLQEITVDSFEGVSIDRNIEAAFGLVAGRDWRARKAADVANDARAHPDGIFVAEEAGRVIGYITTRLDNFTRIGRIPNLAVDPASRAQGIGSALIRHALAYLQEAGMAMAKIETLEQNARGQALYPRFGFREVARQIHYVMPLVANGESSHVTPPPVDVLPSRRARDED
jgi:ribosomal protein S18 acetylase RimI-like enzyme